MFAGTAVKADPFWLIETGVVLSGTLQSTVVPSSVIIQLKLSIILCLSSAALQ